jgi:hypothetical protein
MTVAPGQTLKRRVGGMEYVLIVTKTVPRLRIVA